MSGLFNVLVIVAVITPVVVRPFPARRVAGDRRWWLLPGVLLVLVAREDGPTDPHHEALSIAVLVSGLLAGPVTGAGRGWTARLRSERDGTLGSAGTRATVFVWSGAVAPRAAPAGAAVLTGIRRGRAAVMAVLSAMLFARGGTLVRWARPMSLPYGVAAAGISAQPAWKDRV
ncbi:DUF1453 domain-containing protein [Streptomyces sp. NPDC079020]|uniref:DUF1453 domain-containing protein n=1 Tax=Streptomyces sp. NPDC079020 TaxID=3365722 RepID=UPI0037D4ADF3